MYTPCLICMYIRCVTMPLLNYYFYFYFLMIDRGYRRKHVASKKGPSQYFTYFINKAYLTHSRFANMIYEWQLHITISQKSTTKTLIHYTSLSQLAGMTYALPRSSPIVLASAAWKRHWNGNELWNLGSEFTPAKMDGWNTSLSYWEAKFYLDEAVLHIFSSHL